MNHELQLLDSMSEIFESISQHQDPYPKCIEIHTTDICNQRCQYCFHGGNGFGKQRQQERFMNLGEYAALFQEMADLGIKDLSISGGGEPFLLRQILGVIDQARNNQLRVRIATNGNFISQEAVDRVIQCDEMRVSLDTPDPATYARIRNVDEKMHQLTLGNMAILVKAKQQSKSRLNIGASCIIGSVNATQLLSFTDLMIGRLGIDEVVFKYDIYAKFIAESSSEPLIERQLEEAKSKYGDAIEVRPRLSSFQTGNPCIVPYLKPAINPYGELYSCCLGAQPGEVNGFWLGNVAELMRDGKNNTFSKAWKNGRKIRLAMLQKVLCTSCNYTDRVVNTSYLQHLNHE